jgi:uncharacterized linocin/CFP29 family protein
MYYHMRDPLRAEEWRQLLGIIRAVGNSTVTRRLIRIGKPTGAGSQAIPLAHISITEGYKDRPPDRQKSAIVPIIFKDFTMHWRDLEESRLKRSPLPAAQAAAAAAACARSEDQLALFGALDHHGLMNAPGRNRIRNLRWDRPGDAFNNFAQILKLMLNRGHRGPFAAIVHPKVYSDMHRVFGQSALLEIAHVRALMGAGIYRSSLLEPGTGAVISTGRQNLELIVSVDTSIAFLGARKMNLPFRIFKALCLRLYREDAICTFEP